MCNIPSTSSIPSVVSEYVGNLNLKLGTFLLVTRGLPRNSFRPDFFSCSFYVQWVNESDIKYVFEHHLQSFHLYKD